MPHTTKDIATLFPNLMDIRDSGLRDKVAAVWNEALTTGCGGKGWTFDEIRAIPFTLLAGKIDMRFVEHLNSCCKQCIAITKVLNEVFGSRIPINLDPPHRRQLSLADVGKKCSSSTRTRSGQGRQRPFYGDMLRHPFSGVALCYKHGIPAPGHAHHRHPLPRRRQGRADHRKLDLSPRGLH